MRVCLICNTEITETTNGVDLVHVTGRKGHLPVAEITDWQAQKDVKVLGSVLNPDVYYACYSLAIGAADALAVLNPRIELYCGEIEQAFRRFAVQYKLTTHHEVFTHSHDVISHVVTEAARAKNLPAFTPPF